MATIQSRPAGGSRETGAPGGAGAGAVCDSYPLTPMQQGMLFETVAQDRPWANLQQVVCRLDEAVDVPALRNAWHLAQEHHGVLRSSFRWHRLPEPIQEVHTRVPIPFAIVDWTHLDQNHQEDDLQCWLKQDRATGLALDEAPCMRLTLFRLDVQRAVLVWTFHHGILDGRGFTLVLQEVFAAYDQLRSGTQPIRTPRGEFGDHARVVAERDTEAERKYFSDLLCGLNQSTTLPMASTTSTPTAGHREIVGQVQTSTIEKLQHLALRTDTTLYTCVLAAWGLILSRYSGHNDVVFGSTRSGRHTIPGADTIPGCFINTVPTRINVDPAATADAMLRAIRQDQLDVRPHEQAALVDTQACGNLGVPGPLLTTNVVFEQYLMNNHLRSQGGSWEHRSFEVVEEGGFPLSLAAYVVDGLRLCLEFDPNTYDTESMERMLGHLTQLLQALANAGPDTLVGSLNMLTRAEHTAFTERKASTPSTTCTYLDLFGQAVERYPDSPAVASVGDPGVTYARLDNDANQLAHLLRDLGAGPDSRIGIFLPRSIQFATAVLAVGKAQAAYVPLDPAYPADALEQMLEDCGAGIVITRADVADALPPTSAEVVVVDTDPRIDEQLTEQPERRDLTPNHLAYVIYTSGSTGVPKGVMVSHSALASHADAFREVTELRATDRVLQFASLSFDVSIEQLIPSWLTGACVVLRSDEMASSIATFLHQVDREQLTLLNLPTTFWCEVVRHMDQTGAALPACVRLMVVGGEEVPAGVYNTWTRVAPNVRWLNGYGPTECTITCTIHDPAGLAVADSAASVPIGRPTPNALAYVCDPQGQLLPVGVPGELRVGGPCVAAGYLGLDQLTAAQFQPDPFSDIADSRLYRTGDLVRWLASGDLEFLGRIDRQIKLRGFRVEPREIETMAERHPAVATAVAAIRESGNGEAALILWITPRHSTEFDAHSLRAHMESHLPTHMQPSTIVVVDTLPTTAGGKIDPGALPNPQQDDRRQVGESAPEPRDDLDLTVMSLMAQVLGADKVRLDASFFDLGGHSLLAIRLLDQIEQATKTRLTLPTLHSSPSPYELADVLRDFSDKSQYEYLLPIQPFGSKPPIFGVHVLGENGSFFSPLANRLGPDQPVYGLGIHLVTPENAGAPTDVQEIAAAYARELELCTPEGPVILAAVSLGSVVTMELAQQLTQAGREVSLVALLDARGPGLHAAVSGRERVAIHARRLRGEGLSYIANRLGDRWTELKERAGLARANVHERLGLEVPGKLRIVRFIDDNAKAQMSYDMKPYHGSVAVFSAAEEIFDDPDFRRNGMGWSELARGEFHVAEVPGAHLTMLTEPHVEVLATKLAPLLGSDHPLSFASPEPEPNATSSKGQRMV